LSNFRSRSAERTQPFDFRVSIVWPETEVQPILDRLPLRDRHEQESRQTIWSGPNLELIGVVVDDDPPERLAPPVAERAGVACVDNRLLPLKAHGLIVERCARAAPKRRLRGEREEPERGRFD
jgi:hypothetical protein